MPVVPLARQQAPALAFLLAAALLGWAFLLWLALDMTSPLARLTMPMSPSWGVATATAVFAMWAIMMAAMMLPAALPMVLIFAHLSRRGGRWAPTWAFTGAYVLMWSSFSALATTAHWALQAAGLISPMAVSASPTVTAALLIGAGVFQFTPIKSACLSRCRSPLAFLMTNWRQGLPGAFVMGLRHGVYCIGCCWALMALLFVFGVMNLPVIALLALTVALEKLAPGGPWIARGIGGALILGGTRILLAGYGSTMTGM